MILVYATSTNPADFSTDYKTLFPGRNIMPVNGHVVKEGDTYVYFLDYTEKPAFVFMKQLSEWTSIGSKIRSRITRRGNLVVSISASNSGCSDTITRSSTSFDDLAI